jgi:nicotinamidase-related amidase
MEVIMKHFLIVVDIQKDFVDGALGTAEAVEMIDRAAQKIKNFSGEIFVTYDTHFKDYMNTSEGHKLPVPHCIKGTVGWELNEKIATALEGKKHTAVEKLTFGSVDLPLLIKEAAGEEDFDITLIGLCTDICVVSNALILKANFPEKEIIVDSACCAGVTVESHNAALQTMKMCQINVI